MPDDSLTGYTEARPTAAASDQSHEITSLVSRLRELGKPEAQPRWGRASAIYDHMGAKLADAVLQSGVRYEAFVRPRVDRIARDYPSARTTSGFLELLRAEGPEKVLTLMAGRKLRTILELTQFLVDQRVETTHDLQIWLQAPGNSKALLDLYGVGPKTVSFLKLLVGLDAVAVDMHVIRFVQEAGITLKEPELIEALLTRAGRELGFSGAQVDQLVWRAMASRKAGGSQ
jgi:hypothetical protein